MDIYWVSFCSLAVIQLLIWLATRSSKNESKGGDFKAFERAYLVVYLLAMGGDWLQGPYVYALYKNYGMDEKHIELLFVAGFGASMVFGTMVGSFADKCGRKANCQIYAILYILSCITKHFPALWILLIGRLLGGVATSILFSSFEAWLTCEHNARGFDASVLGSIFSTATTANSVIAIVSGQVAQAAVDKYGFVAPFDASIIILSIMLVAVTFTWTENYGDSKSSFWSTFSYARKEVMTDGSVFYLGLIQALFEGSMYTFVLKWTPALTPEYDEDEKPPYIPHGLIFSAFMVSVMIGSSLFKLLCKFRKPDSFMRGTLFVAALSLCIPLLQPKNKAAILLGFYLFEICVGIFWPAMGTMRSEIVPEQVRSTVMNIFRVPLNLMVIIVLLQNLALQSIFLFCVTSLFLAAAVQHLLYRRRMKQDIHNVADLEMDNVITL